MTAQMTPRTASHSATSTASRSASSTASPNGAAAPAGVAAHAELAGLLVDRPLAVAPWNRELPPVRVARPRHLHVVPDHAPVGRRGVLRTLVAGLALAGLVAFASVGLLAFLGADAAASTPASSTGATPPPAAVAATDAVAESVTPVWVVVRPGDSLWSLARRLQPKGDIRPLVDRLADRLGGAELLAGQRVDVSGLLG